jgi:hypothetical protein
MPSMHRRRIITINTSDEITPTCLGRGLTMIQHNVVVLP